MKMEIWWMDLLPYVHAWWPAAVSTLLAVVFAALLQRLAHARVVAALRQALAVSQSEAEARALAQQQADARLTQAEQQVRELSQRLEVQLSARAAAEATAAQLPVLQAQIAEHKTALAERDEAAARLREQLTQAQTSLREQQRQADEKIELLQQARVGMSDAFRSLASEILEDKSKRFTEQNRGQIEGLLNPLREQIKDFERRVNEVYDKDSRDRGQLMQEVARLKDASLRLGDDATNLTRALKGDSKAQGGWGEVILERVLEASGLEQGREYETQLSFTGEDGRRYQPDAVVHLPQQRDIIVDAKVSLTAYERYCASDSAEERERALGEHVASLRAHCKNLGGKAYQDLPGLQTLDFVLLFVPIEAAFNEAMRRDQRLFQEALERNIVIVTPSTLLATLRTIQNIWRVEYQNRNAVEIARIGGRLHDKFASFAAEFEQIGERLQSLDKLYHSARGKLATGKGNLVRTSQRLQELGAKTSKALPRALVEADDEEFDDAPDDAGAGD